MVLPIRLACVEKCTYFDSANGGREKTTQCQCESDRQLDTPCIPQRLRGAKLRIRLTRKNCPVESTKTMCAGQHNLPALNKKQEMFFAKLPKPTCVREQGHEWASSCPSIHICCRPGCGGEADCLAR